MWGSRPCDLSPQAAHPVSPLQGAWLAGTKRLSCFFLWGTALRNDCLLNLHRMPCAVNLLFYKKDGVGTWDIFYKFLLTCALLIGQKSAHQTKLHLIKEINLLWFGNIPSWRCNTSIDSELTVPPFPPNLMTGGKPLKIWFVPLRHPQINFHWLQDSACL